MIAVVETWDDSYGAAIVSEDGDGDAPFNEERVRRYLAPAIVFSGRFDQRLLVPIPASVA